MSNKQPLHQKENQLEPIKKQNSSYLDVKNANLLKENDRLTMLLNEKFDETRKMLDLETKIVVLSNDKERLSLNLAEKEQICSFLTSRSEYLQRMIGENEVTRKKIEEKVTILCEENEKMHRIIEEKERILVEKEKNWEENEQYSQENIKLLEMKLDQVRSEVKIGLKKEIENSNREMESKDKIINELKERINALLETNDKLNNLINFLKEKENYLNNILKEKEEENLKFKEQINEFNTFEEFKNQQDESFYRENEILKKEFEIFQTKLKQKDFIIDQKDQLIKDLTSQLNKLLKKDENLMNLALRFNDSFRDYFDNDFKEDEFFGSEIFFYQFKEKIDQKIKKITNENEIFKQKLNKEFENNNNQIKENLSFKLEQSLFKINQYEIEIQNLKSQKINLSDEIIEKNSEIQEFQSKILKFQNNIKEKDVQIESLTQSLSEKTRENNELEEKLGLMINENDKLIDLNEEKINEIEEIRSKLDFSTKIDSEDKAETEQLKLQIRHWKQMHENSLKELQRIFILLEKKQEEVDSLNLTINGLKNELLKFYDK